MASFGERIVGVMKADVKTFQEIEADPAAIGQAVTVIVLAGVAALVGNISAPASRPASSRSFSPW